VNEPAHRPAAVFAWREEYRVGVSEIDAQHRRLIELIATFYQGLAARESAHAALHSLLSGLLDYTRYHFATEERLMEKSAFPLSRSHREQHAAFVAKIVDMVDRHTGGGLVLSIEATVFLREWLTDHILSIDKRLGRHLTSHGVR
jgi:hemerythrin